jgi:hypothetical protein
VPNENRNMRRKVVKILKPLDGIAVENPACPGTPDVYYLNGWIELKEADNWPARPDTPLRLPHFKPHQRAWAIRHIHKGGICSMLLKVGKFEWYLLDGLFSANRLGNVTREEIRTASLEVFDKGLDSERFLKCLRSLRGRDWSSPTLNGFCCDGDD